MTGASTSFGDEPIFISFDRKKKELHTNLAPMHFQRDLSQFQW